MEKGRPSGDVNPPNKERLSNNPGMLIILTGFTGAGKTELRTQLTERDPSMQQLVTTTTRAMGSGEINGRDYHFVKKEDFLNGLANGDFVEHTTQVAPDKVTGKIEAQLYGTTKAEIARVLAGTNLVSTMDIAGAGNFAENVRSAYSPEKADALLARTMIVYVDAGGEDALRGRVFARKGRSKTEEEFKKRMDQDMAAYELYKDKFTHTLANVNDFLDFAVSDLEQMIAAEFPDKINYYPPSTTTS